MREFQNKRDFRKMIYSRYTLILLFILIVILANAVLNSYNKYKRSAEENDKSQKELALIEQRTASLNKSIALLNTQDGKEREIRERFGLVKGDEKMVVFVNDTEATSNIPVTETHWWQFFTNFFK